MQGRRQIELLAPAKDLVTARAAIQHGADAIYIGAPRFGARSAAGVSVEDLRLLCAEAHLYRVRVYVALNTILYDHELEEAQQLIWDIYYAGADAVIIQDMGITLMDLPPIALHSSTQCDTVEPEDAVLLEHLGFEQIVLARELNLEQIRRIRAVTTKPLEVFVHGALCVSYSGRCYISQAFTKRSANRGECSQQCRLPYNLLDSTGRLIQEAKHLLSPKDLNRSDLLEELLEVGVSSFKIEGRLKNVSYVKNITAYYRLALDKIIARHPDKYERSSWGESNITFTPSPDKSFNRGFTTYQLHIPTPSTSKPDMINPLSPKSQGEHLGVVKQSERGKCVIQTDKPLANGDGLQYITPQGEAGGININLSQGKGLVTLARPLKIPQGTQIYRNHDKEWERILSSDATATRRLSINVCLSVNPQGIRLCLTLLQDPQICVERIWTADLETAKNFNPQRLSDELRKFGDTIFDVQEVDLRFENNVFHFIPLSWLSKLRRLAAEELQSLLAKSYQFIRSENTAKMKSIRRNTLPKSEKRFRDYRANISNRLARKHYEDLGYDDLELAFEVNPKREAYLMTTKYCIKHDLGYCVRQAKSTMPYVEPLYLEQGGNRIRLIFDCHLCQMYLVKD